MQQPGPADQPQVEPSLRRLAVVLAGVVGVIAVTVLVGWALDVQALKEVVPGLASMKVNTALCLLGLAIVVILPRDHPLGWILLAFVLVVTVLTGVEVVTGVSLGLDELIIEDVGSGGSNTPGRMAPQTVVALLALVVAQVALRRGLSRTAEVGAAIAATMGLTSLLAYMFGLDDAVSEVVKDSTVAVHTAVGLVLLSWAVASLVPDGAVHWLVRNPGPGATAMRRIVPLALVVIPVLDMAIQHGEDLGWYVDNVGDALVAASSALLVLAVAYRVVVLLERADRARDQAQHELVQLNRTLVEGRDEAWLEADAMRRRLDDERQRFDRAISKIDDLLWTVEVHPGGRLAVVFTTPSARGVFGGGLLAGEDFLVLMDQLVHPDDRAALAGFTTLLREGRRGEAEFRLIGRDGRMRWLWCRAGPRREGDRLFVDGITTNVTERHQLADDRERLLALEREQVVRLTELNQLREELVAITGHEMRTPLAAIRGFSELLLQREDLDGSVRDQIGIIRGRAAQMTTLVSHLTELARFTGGAGDLDLDYVRLDALARDAVRGQHPSAEAAGIELRVSAEPVLLTADAMRVRQILDNLVSNAVKYSRPGGAVSVSVRIEEHNAVVEVADNGIGVPEDEIQHLFNRMFRASNAKESGIPGTGLGLSFSKVIAEAHGGSLVARRRAEGGMSFVLTLPLEPSAPVSIAQDLGSGAV